jgi:hypothetical protein
VDLYSKRRRPHRCRDRQDHGHQQWCRAGVTNTFANAVADIFTNAHPDAYANSYADADTYTHSDTNSDTNSDTHPVAFFIAITNAVADANANDNANDNAIAHTHANAGNILTDLGRHRLQWHCYTSRRPGHPQANP